MSETGAQGAYALGSDRGVTAEMQIRQLGSEHAFYTQHLRPGMRLLDVGSGPGALTLSLASVVAPGEVVGIDNDPTMIQRSTALARERGVGNVRFESGDAYRLPFPDASFDAVWSQFVVMHLGDQLAAISEMRRVLRPGGICGLIDSDLTYFVLEPATDLRQRRTELFKRVQHFNGGDMTLARKYRGMLYEAGFGRAEQTVNLDSFGDAASTAEVAQRWQVYFRAQLKTAVEQGWVDQVTCDLMVQDFQDWAARPDAFSTNGTVVAVGFVDP